MALVQSYAVAFALLYAWKFYAALPSLMRERDDTIKTLQKEIKELQPGPSQRPPSPPMPVQMDNFIRALRQLRIHGHVELWLSQLFQFGKEMYGDFLPHRGQIDYPLVLHQLHVRDTRYVEILDTKERKYKDFYGDEFSEDILFRIGTNIS